MRLQRCVSFATAVALLAACAQLAAAQQISHPNDDALARRVEAQGQRIAELEAQLSQRQQPFQVQTAAWNHETMSRRLEVLEAAVDSGNKGGEFKEEWIDSHTQKWSSKFGGRVAFDYVNNMSQNGDADLFLGGNDLEDYGEWRRLWLYAAGEGYGVYDYKFQVDFEPEVDAIGNVVAPGAIPDDVDGIRFGSVAVRDMYLGIKDIPVLGYVRMGQFKEPFSLEQLTSNKFLTFLERSLPDQTFVPSRKVGIAAFRHSACPKWWVGYGAFFNDISSVSKERTNDRQGVDFAGRAAYLPFYANDGRQMMHLGVGGVYRDDADDAVRYRAHPEVHETRVGVPGLIHQPSLFLNDTGTLAADDHFTANVEAALVLGPASVQTEWFWNSTQVAGVGTQSYFGGYVYGSYFLTGEHRPYSVSGGAFGRVKPLENFWIVDTPEGPCMGTGAWEAAFRWSYLDLSNGASPISGIQNDVTLGVNWYWNPYTKMMFNYIHSWNSYSNIPVTPELDILAVRWQFDF
jgi:phosphate-selective porin OprO/OprP